MKTRIFLSPSDLSLVGKYANEHEDIHVIFDSATGGGDVVLPDLFAPVHKEFTFYNLPSSGSGTSYNIVPSLGQTINRALVVHEVNVGDSVGLISDLKSTWVMS